MGERASRHKPESPHAVLLQYDVKEKMLGLGLFNCRFHGPFPTTVAGFRCAISCSAGKFLVLIVPRLIFCGSFSRSRIFARPVGIGTITYYA